MAHTTLKVSVSLSVTDTVRQVCKALLEDVQAMLETSCESALWVKVHGRGRGQWGEHMASNLALYDHGRVSLIPKVVLVPGIARDIQVPFFFSEQ